MEIQDFSGGPVVKTSPSNEGVAGSIPAWGTKIPHVKYMAPKKIKAKKKKKKNMEIQSLPQKVQSLPSHMIYL